jgi:hypothetical protein
MGGEVEPIFQPTGASRPRAAMKGRAASCTA